MIALAVRQRFTSLAQKKTFRKVVGNLSWLLAERLTSLGVALLVTIPVARYLGAGEFGTLSYALGIFGLVGPLATFGLNDIVTKELLAAPDNTGRILGTVTWLRKGGAAVATLIVLAWMLAYPPADPRVAWYAVMICAANLIGSLNFLQYWSLATGTVNRYSQSQMASTTIISVARLILVFLGASLSAFAITAAIEVLLQGWFALIAYRIAAKERVKWRWDWPLAKRILSMSWPMTLASLSAAVYLKLDLVMLAVYRGSTETGIYAAAARISEIWYFVPILIATALLPSLIGLRAQSLQRYHERLQDVLDVLAAAGTVLAVFVSLTSSIIISVLFGPSFAAAGPVLAIHIWAGVFVFMRSLSAKWLIVEDMYVFSLMTHGAGAIANVLLNIVLIPRYGAIGASWATLISYAVASYLALLLSRRTWPMFWMMSRSLFWPFRIRRVVASLMAVR